MKQFMTAHWLVQPEEKQMEGYAIFILQDQGKLHLVLTLSAIGSDKESS